MFLDLDNLKKVNDQFGHSVGDELIVQMGKILLKVIRRHDIAARIGGDEYLVILPDCDAENALKVKNRINEEIDHFNHQSSESLTLSVSIGIKAYENELTYNEFVQAADKKMYEEKNKTKNKGEGHE
jgi:diguanylate cyclase (GGDEF)-like protein